MLIKQLFIMQRLYICKKDSAASTVREELWFRQRAIPAYWDPIRRLGSSGYFKRERSTKEEI